MESSPARLEIPVELPWSGVGSRRNGRSKSKGAEKGTMASGIEDLEGKQQQGWLRISGESGGERESHSPRKIEGEGRRNAGVNEGRI